MAMSNPMMSELDEIESGGGSAIPAVLRDPVGVVRRGWLWMLIGFVLVALPAGFVANWVPLKYEAATRLLLASKRIPDEYVPTTILASAAEQFQAIKSEVFTRPSLAGVIVEKGLYADEIDSVPMDLLVDRLRRSVEITSSATRDPNGRIRSVEYRIALSGGNPQVVASVVNRIAGMLVDANIDYRSEQSRVTSDFMRREFERADTALRVHQRRLADFREEHRGSLPEEEAATIAKLDRLESQRRSIILQINDAQLRARIEPARAPGDPIPRNDVDALKDRLAQQLALFTMDHPNILSLKRQIEQAEKGETGLPEGGQSRNEARREAELTSLRSQLSGVDAEVGRLESMLARTPGITEEFRALEREEEILQESYDEYLRKLKNAELARSMENAQQGSNLTRVEEALVPRSPVVPRLLYYAAAVVVAVGAGVALCLLHALIRPVVIDEDHLASITDLPVLGTVPRVR